MANTKTTDEISLSFFFFFNRVFEIQVRCVLHSQLTSNWTGHSSYTRPLATTWEVRDTNLPPAFPRAFLEWPSFCPLHPRILPEAPAKGTPLVARGSRVGFVCTGEPHAIVTPLTGPSKARPQARPLI